MTIIRHRATGSVLAVAGCLLAALAACGGDGKARDDGGIQDPGPPDPGGPDVPDAAFDAPDVEPGDGGVDPGATLPAGSPCAHNGQCLGAFCVLGVAGYECAARCEEGCGEGTTCLPVQQTAPDLLHVCVPGVSLACTPCLDDGACAGGKCLRVDGTLRCVAGCGIDGLCGGGFTCGDHADADGPVCLPDTGSCDCDAARAGVQRICANQGEAGTCFGTEACIPGEGGWKGCTAPAAVAETCDGLDNDCSGTVDDGLPATQVCARTVAGVGTCLGSSVCAGAQGWTCLAPEPAPEVCDYVDNDCDGEIDEGFREAGVYGSPGNCGACGVACADTVQHATSACDLSGASPLCVVVDCDPGYYPVNPYECASEAAVLCQPCTSDETCAGGACRPFLGGSWCTRDCGDADPCPEGYECADDGAGPRCLPVSGTCDCRPGTEGNRRACQRDGAEGTCHGVEVCDPLAGWGPCTARVPSAEVCNGVDDDCKGGADDGLPAGAPCQRQNAHGTCAGLDACRGAAGWGCNAPEPEAERCDGTDNDCDGTVDEEGAAGCLSWYRDGDGDGAGLTSSGRCLCAPTAELAVGLGGDCNDGNAAISPLVPEACNDLDDDCDGAVDEPGASGCSAFHADADGDAWGSDADALCLCEPVLGHELSTGGDCDDTRPSVHPGAPEVCDGIDNDCDGRLEAPGMPGCTTWFRDADGDGYGDDSEPRCLCGPVPPYTVAVGGDCSDRTAAIGPGAAEVCNGFDDDCDGTVDEEGATGCLATYVDADGDGYGGTASARCLCAPQGQHTTRTGGDCNDATPAIHPGVLEVCNGGIDDDCNGQADEVLGGDPALTACRIHHRDADRDGFGHPTDVLCSCGASGPTPYTADNGDDCDDEAATTYLGASEACNGVDDDCDGVTDVGEFADLEGPGWAIDYQDADGDGTANCVDRCPVYVDRAPPQSSAGLPGTLGHPHATLQAGIDGSGTCDRVLVFPGTYVENVRFNGHDVRLESVGGPAVTTIDGNGDGSTVTFDQGEQPPAALVGFRVTGGTGNSIYSLWKEVLATPADDLSGGGVFVKAASPLIQGNVIVGNQVRDQGGGIFLYASYAHVVDNEVADNVAADENDCGGGILSTNSEALVERNDVHGNQCTGNSGDGAGLMAYASSDHYRANVFHGNWARNNGSGCRLSYYGEVLFEGNLVYGNNGQGVMVSHGTTGRVLNNTIVGNSTYGLYIYISSGSAYSAPLVANNIVAYNDGCGVSDNSDSPFTFTNNDVFGNGTNYCDNLSGGANPTGTAGNVSADPGFAAWSDNGDFADDDFRLAASSPCHDTGTDVARYGVLVDHAGDPRLRGSATDMGAFESAD